MLSRAHFTLSSVSLSNTVRCLWFFMLSQSGFSTKQVDDDDANVKLKPHFGTSGSIPKTSIIRTFLITIICPQYQRFVNINQFLCQFRAFFAECLGKKCTVFHRTKSSGDQKIHMHLVVAYWVITK